MTTYPVYQATFGGSSDCMCHVRLRVAAKDKRDARRKLLAQQNARSNTIGCMVSWSTLHATYVRDDNAVTLVRELRATNPDWRDYKYG